jgi:hypothetical protein
MPFVTELLYAHRVPYVAALALISIACAGCSPDRSTRLSESDLSNPFASQREATVAPRRHLQRHSCGGSSVANCRNMPVSHPIDVMLPSRGGFVCFIVIA